ncbi:FAD-linked oxidoreductase sor8 [Physcia stellaris]|nr:FAD-linked oxidoreductase sor8 [Physcia stellaris]
MASSILLHAPLIVLTALTAINAIAAPEPVVRPTPPIAGGCRFIPSDPEWPSIEEWSSLNISVDGRLIATVPSGSPCFRSTYDVKTKTTGLNTFDEKQCNDVKANWHMPTFHEDSSSSIMQTRFANNSCNYFAPDQSGGQCGIGSYVKYAIDVGSEGHVKAGIAFGKRHNIRVLVRNTGHESKLYNGPALEVSAGVQVDEVYDYLEQLGYMAVGGECPTVGLAGGYIFAGGHAPTSSKLGLAADHILAIQGGTVAYIKSVTFKIFKDFRVSGAIFTMPYAGVLDGDEFWPLIDTWHSITPNLTDAGAYAYRTFNQAYKGLFPFLGSGTFQWTSRLIPRNVIQNQPQAVSKTLKALFDDGATMVETVMNPNLGLAKPLIDNSVLPAWRTSIVNLVVGKPYNDSAPFQVNVDARTYITQHWTSALEQLAPVSAGGGAYMNEADADDPNWQESFYGRNYPKQLAIKRKYDPTGFWYAKKAVGSEYWSEDAQQRLCPTRPRGRESYGE